MKAILFVILNVTVCFPRGAVGVEILIPGGFGGSNEKIFQAHYRSRWPPCNTPLIFALTRMQLFSNRCKPLTTSCSRKKIHDDYLKRFNTVVIVLTNRYTHKRALVSSENIPTT